MPKPKESHRWFLKPSKGPMGFGTLRDDGAFYQQFAKVLSLGLKDRTPEAEHQNQTVLAWYFMLGFLRATPSVG